MNLIQKRICLRTVKLIQKALNLPGVLYTESFARSSFHAEYYFNKVVNMVGPGKEIPNKAALIRGLVTSPSLSSSTEKGRVGSSLRLPFPQISGSDELSVVL